MADFNFNLNRQGPQGVQGPQGEPGFSPTISVDTNTAAEYKLLITTVDGSFVTDNLRGNEIDDRGGSYVRYDNETAVMFAGPPDYATDESYGEVILATDDDILVGAEDKVVTADRIFDLNEVITTQGSTLTSLQTQIDTISGEIPVVNNGTLTIQRNGVAAGSFEANSSANVTVNIPVPTDTGDLTNNAGFITSSALTPYATTTQLSEAIAAVNNTIGGINAGLQDCITIYDLDNDVSQGGLQETASCSRIKTFVTTQISQATSTLVTESTLTTAITSATADLVDTTTLTTAITTATQGLVDTTTMSTAITTATQDLVDSTTMSTAITSATSTMVTSSTVRQIVQVTQAQYDAITTPDPNTMYLIVN